MRRNKLLITLLSLLILGTLSAQERLKHRLRIIDAESNLPIDAAFISAGRVQQLSTADGYVELTLSQSFQGNISIQCLGYHSISIPISELCSPKQVCTLKLTPQNNQLQSIEVHAERKKTSASTISTQINQSDINKSLGQSLSSLLERVSGVSSIQTGANTSKPVIHGMHGNRILLINNGVRQSGQQWGDGHAPEVDVQSNEQIQVIKGVDGVRYGSEALGGIIIMGQRPLPYGADSLGVQLTSLYGSNGRRSISTARVEGTLPYLPKFAWRLQGTYGNAGDKASAKYLLNNTGSREQNASAMLGYRSGNLRVEGFYSYYNEQSAIMQTAQLGSIDLLYERIALGRPSEEILRPFSRKLQYPREQVIHHTLTAKAIYDSERFGTITLQTSYQKDDRREYQIRRTDSSVPEVALNLSSIQHQARWEHSYGLWQSEVGAMMMDINNYSTSGTGVVPIIPNYTEHTWGIYGIQRYYKGKLRAELGLRLDGQLSHASGYNRYGDLYGGKRDFTNFTYSLGGQWTASRHLSLTSNLGVAWRAPHVHELYSQGVEHGAAAFMIGDSTLRAEQSYKWITSLSYRTQHIHLQLDGYLQWVHNFIYDEPQLLDNGYPEVWTLISGAYPIFRYRQTGAFFRGVDLSLQYQALPNLSYKLSTALIWANERKNGSYLPYIPPMRIDHSFKWSPKLRGSWESSISVGHRFVAKQTRFNPHRDLISYTPDAYHLFSLELEAEYSFARKHSLRAILGVENLFNKEYKEYTNRARYYSHDLGRDVRLSLAWIF